MPPMITMFHTSGVSAGIVKWSCAFRIPTTRPLSPSRITIGKSTRDRPTVSASSCAVNCVAGEQRHDHRRERDEGERDQREADEQEARHRAGRVDRVLAPLLLEQLGEDGHERARERGVGDERADQVRDLEGEREARRGAAGAVVGGGDDLAGEAGDPREPGEHREDRGVARPPGGGAPARLGAAGRRGRLGGRPARGFRRRARAAPRASAWRGAPPVPAGRPRAPPGSASAAGCGGSVA